MSSAVCTSRSDCESAVCTEKFKFAPAFSRLSTTQSGAFLNTTAAINAVVPSVLQQIKS